MVPASGRKRAPLSEQLRTEAYRFDFFQAVRLLERMAAEQTEQDASRQRRPVGLDHAPRREVVRFRAFPSHSFPAGSIGMIRAPDPRPADQPGSLPPEMIVAFMGLTGPGGVLPQHYTTLLIERVREKDFALRDFLDVFNHRIISLFYRAWEKYRFAISYERSELDEGRGMRGQGRDLTPGRSPLVPRASFLSPGHPPKEDLFTRCLYCLLGLGTGGLRRRMGFDDEAFLYYAGYFAHRPRAAVSLELMLGDYFEMPVKLRQFQGQWLYLSRDDQSSLPCPRWPQGLNTRLGASVVIGERVWDVGGKFRVRLGPLGYRDFCRFVPSGDALGPLCQMVRCYVGPQFDFDVQPVLKAAEVPWCRLGGDQADPSRLGWNTWIRSGHLDHDVSDAVFSLEGLPQLP